LKGGEGAPLQGPRGVPPPPPTPTFVDVAKDMQPRLDAPLHRVEQLHAAHPLHLLGDPVQEACVRKGQEGSDRVQEARPPAPQTPRRSFCVSETRDPGFRDRAELPPSSQQALPRPPCPRLQGGKARGSTTCRLGPGHLDPLLCRATQTAMLTRAPSGPGT